MPNLNPTPPAPVPACANLGVHTYLCGTDSPGNLVFDGKGAIQISVVSSSSNGVQFSQIVTYRPNSWLSPSIQVQNGTGSSNTHQIVPSSSGASSQIKFDVPVSDDFTISAFYSEYGISAPPNAQTGNTSTCPNPPNDSEKCWRYHKIISLDAGTTPTCAPLNGTPFVIVINQFDPNQHYTECI
jgi:hypothetical protein